MGSKTDVTQLLDKLKLIKALKKSPFLPNIKEIFSIAHERLQRVPAIFPHYTMHDIGHSVRIIKHMGELVHDVKELSQLELALLVYSAILHDIGMGAKQEDIDLFKEGNLPEADIRFSAMLKYMGGDDVLATQEYVRRIHGKLSARYIRSDVEIHNKLTIPGMGTISFAEELAVICQSHTESYEYINRKLLVNDSKGEYRYNGQYVATILRLADILDIDPSRAPYSLYRLINPKGESESEWKQHFIISNTNKVLEDEKTGQKKILFQGHATSAKFHRKLLGYIGNVKTELQNAVAQVKQMSSQYSLFIETIPEIQIQPKGYTFSDFQMTLQFNAISSLLMGEKIYGSKSLGLRELIQNSIDACKTRQENQENARKIGQDKYVPRIKIILDDLSKQVIIKDNGAGMTGDIIKNHFLNIGVSYYSSKEFALRDLNYKPIGNFGIGFLSCFMLSDEVTVYTRHYQSNAKFKIDLEKGSEFTSLTQEEDLEFEGTEVILQYSHFMSAFDNKPSKVEEFIQQYFLPEGIEISLLKSDDEEQLIERPTHLEEKDLKGLIKVDFTDSLYEFNGYALIRPKSNFVHNFDEIDFSSGEIFLYNNENGFVVFDKSYGLEIDNILSERELKYMSIPIVDSDNEKAFLSGLEFTEGEVDKVIEKMGKNLRWITVLFKNDEKSFVYEREIHGEDSYDETLFNHLVSLGHSAKCKTKIFTPILNLFEGTKNELYLPFEKSDKDTWSYYFYKNPKGRELFIRNVLIIDFPFDFEYTASLFDIVLIEANVISRKIIPDISRNKVELDTVKTLNYAMGKAIHLGASKKMALTSSETETLNNFIDSYYSRSTEFEKI